MAPFFGFCPLEGLSIGVTWVIFSKGKLQRPGVWEDSQALCRIAVLRCQGERWERGEAGAGISSVWQPGLTIWHCLVHPVYDRVGCAPLPALPAPASTKADESYSADCWVLELAHPGSQDLIAKYKEIFNQWLNCWQLEIGCGGSIDTTEMNKCYKSASPKEPVVKSCLVCLGAKVVSGKCPRLASASVRAGGSG